MKAARLALLGVLLALPAAAPPSDSELPAGHPPVGAARAAPAPHAAADPHAAAPTPDSTLPAKDLPRGTVEARIVDAQDRPLPGTEVRLGILRQSVAEGEERSHLTATSGPDGTVRFSGLQTGSEHSYRITVVKPPAEYASDPFTLGDSGQRVLLHVYPVTADVNTTLVGMRGFVVVEPRDDVFQFQVMFRVFNMGRVTWVPQDVTLGLPPGWKAFNAQESMTDARVVSAGDRVKLVGTYSPGEHEVSFSFQVPNEHDESAEFQLDLPPHVAELRVIAEASRGMQLDVEGFDRAEPSTAQGGQRVLVAGRRLRAGEPELRDLTLRLSGIPTPGPGRWIAALIAALAVAAGLATALSRDGSAKRTPAERDRAQARDLLLSELVALEKAHAAGDVGPRTYESTRRLLLDAVARLEAQRPPRPAKRKSTALTPAEDG